MSERPNICIIIVDSLRADHLSCYGYGKKTSPGLDAIAGRSLRFENASAQSNWTYPALYSLISGRYPGVHNINWFNQRIDPAFKTLPEVLSRLGYQTTLLSSFRTLTNKNTFGRHFDETRLMDIDEGMLEYLQGWAAKKEGRFLVAHIGDYVHEPYDADKKYVDMFYESGYAGLEVDAVVEAMTAQTARGQAEQMRDINRKLNMHLKRLTTKQLAYITACYDAGIYYVDKFIVKFHEIILNRLDDYIFIITADHGQCFFEHGFYGHGLHLYDEVIRVPLIIDAAGGRSGVIREPVQHIDIYPTLLEILSITKGAPELDGTSLRRSFSPEAQETRRIAVSEAFPFISIRDNTHKLITSHFKTGGFSVLREIGSNLKNKKIRKLLLNSYAYICADKFYNTAGDPLEKHNLRDRQKERYQSLLKELSVIAKGILSHARLPLDSSVDAETERQLRNLGYI